MKTMTMRRAGVAMLAIGAAIAAAPSQGQTIPSETPPADETPAAPVEAADIIVTGRLTFRNRTVEPNPVLSYDYEYFQRFEPVSVGEMLKRVPGVTFTSDVLEYDGVQLRGLPPGFTQVLINGRRAPGGESDRSFFVDRIPAELVERIEIVRAPRADQPSDGIAGTLNIITKESNAFDGGFVKLGSLINEDGKVRPSAAAAYADTIGDTSFWGAVNYQERRNPKKKTSLRFAGEPARRDVTDPAFDNTELQDDTRDGSDLSGNAEVTQKFGDADGFVRLSGFFVDTDRDEDETSTTFEGPDLEYDGVEVQHEEINQQTYAVTADTVIPLGGVKLGLAGGWSGYRENSDIFSSEGDNEDDPRDVELVETEALDIKDDEFTGTASLTFGEAAFKIKAGVDLLDKKRVGTDLVTDVEDDETEGDPAVNFRIKERRYDPYVRVTWEPVTAVTVDAGLRYEITRRRATGEDGTVRYDAESFNPSAHLRYALTPADQFRASVARTTRRPNYDLISAYEQDESPGDDDVTIGNPALKNERAWGVDVGYERRLPGNGIAGVNAFYRDITDLTELVVIGDNDDGQRFTPRNIGDGEVYGVEFDLSVPLAFAGLPDTGLFANYTYLDSRTRDPFTGTRRRFNNQPHHVYNIGFIQNVKSVEASFGATVSGRSKALESNFDETIDLTYTPDLEAFVEKRFGKNFVVRGTVSNLLDRKKRETFRKYDGDSFAEILDNRASGEIDEFETERERSGRLFQLTLRAAF